MLTSVIVIAVFCVTIFGSNVIQGITGFAGTLIAMPFLIMLMDLNTAKQVLNFLGIVGSALILVRDYRYIQWKKLLTILVWMGMGVVIGLITYNIAPRRLLMILFPLFLLYVGIRGVVDRLRNRDDSGSSASRVKDIIILLCAGIIHGLFVAGGPLLVVYVTRHIKEKNSFRATLSMVWIILNSAMLIQALVAHAISLPMGRYMLISMVPMVAGIMLGNQLLKRLKQSTFMMLSYSLLILSGISMLF